MRYRIVVQISTERESDLRAGAHANGASTIKTGSGIVAR